MRKVFEVELSSENGCTELTLPAAPYALLDALEKLELADDEAPRWEILRMHSCGHLSPYLDHGGTLTELDALTQRLSELGETELSIVDGLIQMEQLQPGITPVPLPRLIDLAYSTDCCHLVEGVVTDAQLGRFCAEAGLSRKRRAFPMRPLNCWTLSGSAGSSGRPRAAYSPAAATSSGVRI